jgi:hypothetical protein
LIFSCVYRLCLGAAPHGAAFLLIVLGMFDRTKFGWITLTAGIARMTIIEPAGIARMTIIEPDPFNPNSLIS